MCSHAIGQLDSYVQLEGVRLDAGHDRDQVASHVVERPGCNTTTRTEQRTSRKITTTSKKAQPARTPEERAAEVEALAEQLNDAVAELTTSEAWVGMLRVAARFTRYSPTNCLLLWMQAEQRGVTLSRVAGYRAWQALGRQVVKGAKSLAVRAPVRRRLTVEEATERARTGQRPAFDADGQPALVMRGFRLEWAAAIWDVQGPANDRFINAMPAVEEFLTFATRNAVPGNIHPDGRAAHLYQAADRGEMPREKCPVMMLDYVTPSLDTTILGITNTVALFAEHPEQWDLLRADRSLIPHAINESLRIESPVPQFSRVLTEDHDVGGVMLEAGSRVALLYGSANRDGRHYPEPTRFDITRKPSDHLAFGRGEHVCVGMHLARLEMGALLERLADRVERFEVLASTPMLNNGLRGLESLEVAVY